jgi:trk system potassium uptake protein TrkA
VGAGAAGAGKKVRDLGLPDGSLVISILRDGQGFVPAGDSVVQEGDEVLVVLDVGLESQVTERFAGRSEAA